MKALMKLICIGACCLTINAIGQTSVSQSMNARQRADYVNQHITGLTPDQQSKIATIEEEYLGQGKRVNATATDSLRRATDNKIRAVLTNEQYEQYQNLTMYPH
jgi:hypothetical protein